MRIGLAPSLLATSLAASLLAGCTEEPPAGPTPYRLVSTVELTSEAILPREIDEIVATLRDFSADPAATMRALAEEAAVPEAAVLRGELPISLASRLDGWIAAEIEKATLAGQPVTAFATEIATLVQKSLTRLGVETELDLEAVPATHRITGLDLGPAGRQVRAPIEPIEGDALDQAPAVTVGADGALAFGEQRFGLAYGAHAWTAIEAASTQVYGAGVRQALGDAIDCGALARAVAEQCVLGVCVAHEAELRAVCAGGLDALVARTREALAARRLDELHLANGTAKLDGDRITDGVWQAELNLGAGMRAAPATFSGGR